MIIRIPPQKRFFAMKELKREKVTNQHHTQHHTHELPTHKCLKKQEAAAKAVASCYCSCYWIRSTSGHRKRGHRGGGG